MQKINKFIEEYSFLGGKKVGVAISGGVDSSVAAYLLKSVDANVFGIHMNINVYNSDEVAVRAKDSAEAIGIPFHCINVATIFKNIVIDEFLSTYSAGHTPNPCLICNHHIKWQELQTYALEQRAEYFATGHYGEIVHFENKPSRLFKAKDLKKDQSYVLSVLSQKQLSKTIFPLGNFSKNEIRDLAELFKIPSAKTKDSQDLCFLQNGMLPSFLDENIPASGKPGDICMLDGKIVGKHKGLHHYTIGQRKGLGIAYVEALYVLKKDIQENKLYVCKKNELRFEKLRANHVNWISGKALQNPFSATVKIRYAAQPAKATVYPQQNGELVVEFENYLIDVTPGQGVVVYDEDEVICSGFIDNNYV